MWLQLFFIHASLSYHLFILSSRAIIFLFIFKLSTSFHLSPWLHPQNPIHCSHLCNFSQIHWHPYIVDPDTKVGGEPYLAYNKRRYGGDGWVAGMKAEAQPDGALFRRWGRGSSPADLRRCMWANTLNAHCLLHMAKEKHGWEGMHRLKQRLLKEYYECNQNISKTEVLCQIWSAVFPSDDAAREARNYLESGVAQKTVLAKDAKAKKNGRIQVPNFIVSFCHGGQRKKNKRQSWFIKKRNWFDWVRLDSNFSGAQLYSTWTRLFLQMQDYVTVTRGG